MDITLGVVLILNSAAQHKYQAFLAAAEVIVRILFALTIGCIAAWCLLMASNADAATIPKWIVPIGSMSTALLVYFAAPKY